MNSPLYYLSTGGVVTGPYHVDQVRSMWQAGGITADTLACPSGTEAWQPVQSIATTAVKAESFKATGKLTPIGKIGVPLFTVIALPALAVGQIFIGVPLLLLAGITYCKARR